MNTGSGKVKEVCIAIGVWQGHDLEAVFGHRDQLIMTNS